MDPLKVLCLDHLRSICARAETPTSLVEGKSLDENARFVCHRLSEKGELLWYQINSLLCYAWNLCEIMTLLVALRTLKTPSLPM